jgi:hypothetical protein
MLEREWADGEFEMFPSIAAIEPNPFADLEWKLHRLDGDYAGFNLICGRISRSNAGLPPVQLVSNRTWPEGHNEQPAQAGVTNAPEGRVTCFSNGTLGARWRKTDWVRDQVSACLSRAPSLPEPTTGATDEVERQAVLELFDELDRSILREETCFADAELSAAGDDRDMALSPLPLPLEREIRRRVYLAQPQPLALDAPAAAAAPLSGECVPPPPPSLPLDLPMLATRSISAVIVTRGRAHFLHRSTDGGPADRGPVFHHTALLPPL